MLHSYNYSTQNITFEAESRPTKKPKLSTSAAAATTTTIGDNDDGGLSSSKGPDGGAGREAEAMAMVGQA